jgi:hypothetical protein
VVKILRLPAAVNFHRATSEACGGTIGIMDFWLAPQ